MSVADYFFPITCGQKGLIAIKELCAHEYEHTSHIATSHSFRTQRPYSFILYGRLLFLPLLGKKGDDLDDGYRTIQRAYRDHVQRFLQGVYHAALDVYYKIKRKQQYEVPFEYLKEIDFEPSCTDEYFAV